MTANSPATRPNESSLETVSGMAISLAFWLCLLVSAGLFAMVALSPKALVTLQLRNQFHLNQLRLVALESQADRLQRVIDAIRNDKDFASELTRIEFDAVRPGEEVLPVDTSLELDRRILTSPAAAGSVPEVWYEPVVQFVAADRQARRSLIIFAAVLVVISFTILQPEGRQRNQDGIRRTPSLRRILFSRYVRQS